MRWLALACVLAAACDDADDGVSPRIDLVAPPQAEVGEVIDILGERFCSAATGGGVDLDAGGGGPNPCSMGFVTFGDEPGLGIFDVEDWSETRITIRVPNMRPGPTGIVVTVNGRQSKVAEFEVIE